MDWTSVFSATIALMCAILTAVVIPYLKNKIGDGKWAEIVRIVKVLVTAAEQIFQSTDGEKLGKDRLEWECQFLKGDEIVEITSYEEEILGINLPAKVALTITECEPAVRGDTVNKAMKEALLETGLRVRVPLFIESGETILVRTDNAEYDGRA